MGLDINIVALRRKKLEEAQQKHQEYTIKQLYEAFFCEIYYENKNCSLNNFGIWIASQSTHVFNDFFQANKIEIKPDELFEIDEETYRNMFQWIEEKLQKATLLEVVENKAGSEHEIQDLIQTYKDMLGNKVDFNKYIVFFRYDE